MERVGALIKGMYRDVLTAGDGRILYDSGWAFNTIVDRCRILLAGFMKNESTGGIKFLAVGQGSKDWDDDNKEPPTPEPKSTNLVNRYDPTIPVNDLTLVYLNEDKKTVASNPTNLLQITATLNPGYPTPLAPLKTYPLREFGLFGSFGKEDYMINNIRHPVIHKDATTTLVRVIRLYF